MKEIRNINILAIESSCDETAAAVVHNGRKVLSNIISSQIDLHKLYGGVVPEIASRKHIEKINQVIEEALKEAEVTLKDIDAVAVTYGPGLVGALLVGVAEAKAIAYAAGLPLVGVHHIEGHISANYIEHPELEPPFLCLVASGGHTHLVCVKDYGKYEKNPVVTGEMLPEGCSRIDFRDPKIWKENDTYYLIVGNKNDNQVGQVVLCSSKNLTDWKFETILASNENGDIGTMWECPDFFALKDKHVLICSPQDMKARKYEFHNGHNSVYFLGDYDANRCRFSKEQPHTLDYGMDFYAPQTTELPDGRRIMIAWMKSWDACVIPNSQDWQGMMTFPRELEIKENRIWQNPVKELENYYQNPCCYEHTEIEGETVLAGVEGRTIDLTVTLEDGENTIFSIKLAADSEYETSYTYNKETRLLEIDRTYCGVTKDVVCVRKFRIEDPAGLKKMRFILDYHSIELFINDGQQTATTAICTPLNAKDIYFFSDKKMTMSVEKHDIIM